MHFVRRLNQRRISVKLCDRARSDVFPSNKIGRIICDGTLTSELGLSEFT